MRSKDIELFVQEAEQGRRYSLADFAGQRVLRGAGFVV